MVRISLPLDVLRSNVRPVCASTLTFQLARLDRQASAPGPACWGRLPEHADHRVPGALGECSQIPFLALARLIVRADATINGNVSQLTLLQTGPFRRGNVLAFV